MKANVVRIGNSRGLRIPKALLEQTGIADEVEITVRKDALIVRPVSHPRAGWAELFAEMARRRDDRLVTGDHVHHAFDEEEWEWK